MNSTFREYMSYRHPTNALTKKQKEKTKRKVRRFKTSTGWKTAHIPYNKENDPVRADILRKEYINPQRTEEQFLKYYSLKR